ncbi:hypothetical protein BX600DRAFT_509077 [Xylariales sp. PMI_506]|nr:hypothetical protein BX600DRAFT_509077 [Xylariales sp. PMI_506]
MKRKAQIDIEQGLSPQKRAKVASLKHPLTIYDDGSVLDDRAEYVDYPGPDSEDSDHDDDGSVTNTAPTPITPMSGMSPSRPRFPSDLKTIRCTWPGCTKSFNRPARLTAHLRSHTNERPFKCTFPSCDKSYLEEKHLKQHLKGSHSTERSYTCAESGCGKSFLTSTRLRRHQLVHEGQERFRCREYPPCNQSFRKHQTLQRHIRAEHLQLSAYPCAHAGCSSGFDTAASLKRHVEREHGDIKFWCEECEAGEDADGVPLGRVGFPTLELLQKHMQKAHINCMFCDLVFKARDDLDNHIESQHSKSTLEDRKKVACTWEGCTKTFVKQANLKVHIRSVHEGFRFICGEVDVSTAEDLTNWPHTEGCGDGFTTKGNLENHVRYVHLGLARPQATKGEQQALKDMLGQVTSTSDRARRTIACTWDGCPLRFAQQADMEAHLHSHLQLTLDPGSGSVNGLEPGVDFGLTLAFDHSQPVTPGLGEEWGYAVPEGMDALDYFSRDDTEWQRDEAEMRQLIGSAELDAFIDPSLDQI